MLTHLSRRVRPIVGAAALLSSVSAPLIAGPLPPRTQQASCDAPAFREFDFWLGTWDVSDTTGTVVGTNRIDAIHGGCALREQWTGRRGMTGTSLNAYDAGTKRWYQTWVDNNGLVLRLSGGLERGEMVLSGDVLAADGKRQLHRIRWGRMDAGRVRQTWEVSADGGASWSVAFVGVYTPRR